MITEQWQLGLLIGVFAVHLLAVGLAYRRHSGHAEAPESASAPGRDPVDDDEGVVECPACGSENELGYRFCRSCVGELPSPMRFGGAGGNPLWRIAR